MLPFEPHGIRTCSPFDVDIDEYAESCRGVNALHADANDAGRRLQYSGHRDM